jgi:hypothetical protein
LPVFPEGVGVRSLPPVFPRGMKLSLHLTRNPILMSGASYFSD